MPDIKNCRITNVEALSENVTNFEIQIIDDNFDRPILDTLEAGAHVDVYLNDDIIRQYSIWDWSHKDLKVSVAVKREDEGNGGSLKMHQLQVGHLLGMDGPRNNFKLLPNAPHYTLIAGGIGVTPIFAMARELVLQNAKVAIYYLVQKEELAAFAPHFEQLGLGDQSESSYQLHCDDKDGMFDFDSLIKKIPSNSVIYTCGPELMLNKVIASVENHPNDKGIKHQLHFERFTLATEEAKKGTASFEVKINSSGAVYTVNEDETILTVLSDNGVEVPSACTAGLCGTCITDVLAGEIDHRDGILSDDEKASNEYMCVCISRAKSAQITLDL